MSVVAPGLQYPGHLDESTPDGAAIKSVFDNLFYLRGLVNNPLLGSAGVAQVQKIVQEITVNTGPSTAALSSLIVGTHTERVTVYGAATQPVGTQFWEYDRTSLYVISDSTGIPKWTYVAGLMQSTFANRPTDLTTTDVNFTLFVTTGTAAVTYNHYCLWTGAAWIFPSDRPGLFVDAAMDPGDGYQLCDGTATTILTKGADLSETAFIVPDEVTAPAGVYHRSVAVYTGIVNAAVAPTLAGATAAAATGVTTVNESAHTHTVTSPTGAPSVTVVVQAGAGTTVATDTHTHTVTSPTGVGSAHNHAITDPTHTHGVGTLTVTTTTQMRNLEVLRYFRR